MPAPRPPRRNPKPPRPPRASGGERAASDAPEQAASSSGDGKPSTAALDRSDSGPVAANDAAVGDTGPGGPKRFPCGQCGAKLVYQPGVAKLVCQYCGYENRIPQHESEIRELDFERALAELATAAPTQESLTVACQACGARIERPAGKDAFACPFCGTDIVATAVSQRLVKPNALLPFGVEQAEARARFKHWARTRWFAPNALKRYNRTERLAGVYVPYWTFDCNTTSAYTGQRGEYYYVTVGSGKNRRTVRRTRWYPASGVVFNWFNDVLILASTSLPYRLAERLRPWRLNELVPYDDAYLSGFQAERYTVDLVAGFSRAKQVMHDVIDATVRDDIGGDEQRVTSIRTQFDNITFKHLLLPIWISAYQYRGKTYRYLVNGQTGEVQGERPYSWIKITLAVLAGLAVIAGVLWWMQASGMIDL